MHAAICLQQHFPGYVRRDAFRKTLKHMLSKGEIHLRIVLSVSEITVFVGVLLVIIIIFSLFCARVSKKRFIVFKTKISHI